MYTTALPCLPKKTCTLAGFERGSSALESDAMSTAPSRQGKVLILTLGEAQYVITLNQ
jgi:hypothetical protein